MFLEDIAERLDQVRWTGTGFTARCPAHEDNTPSLNIRRGSTGVLIKCQVGCTFFQVVEAMGLRPIDFKYDTMFTSKSHNFTDKTAEMMKKLTVDTRVMPKTFEAVCDIALEPDLRVMSTAMMDYPEFINLEFDEAMKMSVIAFDGPIYVMVKDHLDRYGPDYGPETKAEIGRRLWHTWRTGKSGR